LGAEALRQADDRLGGTQDQIAVGGNKPTEPVEHVGLRLFRVRLCRVEFLHSQVSQSK